MKKAISSFTAISIALVTICALCFSAAAAGTVNMRLTPSKTTLREGETFTVTLSANGAKAAGGIGNAGPLVVSFDTSRLEYVSTAKGSKISGSGDVSAGSQEPGELLLDFNPQSAKALQEDGSMFVMTFKVKKGVSSGSSLINLKAEPAAVANAANQTLNVVTQGASVTFAKALSGENKLRSLSLGNGTLSPGFSPGVTKYSVSVPFTVTRLAISAAAADVGAAVSVANKDLTPGGTTQIRITVKAANGSEKVYTVAVTRAADPNAPTTEAPTTTEAATTEGTTIDPVATTGEPLATAAPSVSALKTILTGGFPLSPGFTAEQKEYTLWVTNETTDLEITGIPVQGTSAVEVAGGDKLIIGANLATVVCTAADGSKTEYKLKIYRPQPIGEEDKMFQKTTPQQNTGGIKWWLVLLIALLAFAVGGAAGLFLAPQYRARKF